MAMSASFRASYKAFTCTFVTNAVKGRSALPLQATANTVEHISSVQNKHVKHCVKLRTSASYRSENGHFLLAGATVLVEQFKRGQNNAPEMDNKLSIPEHIIAAAHKVVTVETHVMKKLAGVQDVASIGAIAELAMPQGMTDQQWQHARRVLVLDRVQDPGNLGTLLRNAEALDWDAVYLLDGCCDVFNEKAIRAARGATFTVSVSKGAWPEFLLRSREQSMLLIAAAAPSHIEAQVIASSESTHDVWEDRRTGSDGDRTEEAAAATAGVDKELNPSFVGEGQGLSSAPLYQGIDAAQPDTGGSREPAATATAGGLDEELNRACIGEGQRLKGENTTESAADSVSEIQGSELGWRTSGPGPDLVTLFEELEYRKVALVLGSEGQGIRPEISKECKRVSIPMIGETESLNVAAAGSMMMLVLSQSLKGVLQRVHGAMHS